MPIDRPSTRGYVLLPLAAPHHRREGLVHERPSTRGGQALRSPLPAAVEALTRTYRRCGDAVTRRRAIAFTRQKWGRRRVPGPVRWLATSSHHAVARLRLVADAIARREGSAGSKAIAARSGLGTGCRIAVGGASSAAPSGPLRVGMEVRDSCSLWPFSPSRGFLCFFLEVDICRVRCR